MSGFLSKLKPSANKLKSHAGASAKYMEVDEIDPRIVYTISERARRISIKLDTAGRKAVVTAPSMRALPAAKKFAREKTDWIAVHLEDLPVPQPFEKGAKIYFKGELTQIISPEGRARPHFKPAEHTPDGQLISGPRLVIPSPEGSLEGRTRRFLIRQAREALEPPTHYYAQQLGKEVTRITVRDTKSRWGSCAPNGHISYSWRLVCAPPFVLDYVAAHEAAHLVEANHSQDFWDVVDTLVDSVKPAKKWLRQNGPKLHAVGANF